MTLFPEEWASPKKILVILAHPDDPEFFLGGMIARWTSAGNEVHYCLFTSGDKGASDPQANPQDLARIRETEERLAANILNVSSIQFLGYADGYLVPDLELRKKVVRVIRQMKPDILVSCDPENYYPNNRSLNHPDHRAVGRIVVDASFPAAGNPLFFPELMSEGIQPHSVEELWLSVTHEPNLVIDITDFWHKKIEALRMHKSQIGDEEKFLRRMLDRRTQDSSLEEPRFEEKFRRIKFG